MKYFIAIIIILAFLIVCRLSLGHWVTGYVNRRIATLEGYNGSVQDIELHLWRGAYQLHGLNIYKTKSGVNSPFVAADSIDLSIEWKALIHGMIVAEIDIKNIALNFARDQNGKGADWADFINDLTPFEINRLNIDGGKVVYIGYPAKPDEDLYINNIHAEITNLRNVEKKNIALPSEVYIQGNSIGKGNLVVKGRGSILKDVPDFDLGIKLENASLSAFNTYTRKVGINFSSGKISIYSELAATNGNVTGYIKPIATHVTVINAKQGNNVINVLWETMITGFIEIFKNQPHDQFAMRIPIEGNFNNPQTDAWTAFLSIFENAFVKAFPRNTDNNIDFNAIKNQAK